MSQPTIRWTNELQSLHDSLGELIWERSHCLDSRRLDQLDEEIRYINKLIVLHNEKQIQHNTKGDE